MKIYPIDNITKDVRIVLDENPLSVQLESVGDVDTLSLNEIIISKICDGVKIIHSNAPAYLLDGGYNFGDSVYWNSDYSGWVLLPEDFMRFVVFEMDDWAHAVYSCRLYDDERYLRQSSRFRGIRGNAQRPECYICIRPEGRVLEFYSCKSNSAHVSHAVYLPYPQIDSSGGVEICERCYSAVVYTIASLVLSTIGESERVQQLSETAKMLLI